MSSPPVGVAAAAPARPTPVVSGSLAPSASPAALRLREEQAQEPLDGDLELRIVLGASGVLAVVGPEIETMLARRPADLEGRPAGHLVDGEALDVLAGLMSIQAPGAWDPVRLTLEHADGHDVPVVGTLTNLLAHPAVGGFLLTLAHDLGEEPAEPFGTDATDDDLDDGGHEALRDPLTGLPTRALFLDRLAHELVARADRARAVAVVVVDVEGTGRSAVAPDQATTEGLVVDAAQRVAQAVRASDTATRLSDHRFGLLLEDSTLEAAQVVADRVRLAFEAPLQAGGHREQVRVRIGVAPAVPGETSARDAVRDAVVAVRWARDRDEVVAVHDAALHELALDRLRHRSDLEQAVRADQLRLHFQPVVDVSSESVVGFEALVRWQHGELGLLLPDQLLPVAEQTQMLVPLGRWVLEHACAFAATLPKGVMAGDGPMIGVNVSAQELAGARFVDDVLGVLAATGLPPGRLVLEVTETLLLGDDESLLGGLRELRAHGVRVALDDLSSGYAVLSRLAHAPLDVLKVDRSCVEQAVQDPQTAAITRAVLAMASTMHLTTVAEGVERPEELAWLRATRCGLAQGLLWSPPVEATEARRMLTAPRLPRTPSDG